MYKNKNKNKVRAVMGIGLAGAMAAALVPAAHAEDTTTTATVTAGTLSMSAPSSANLGSGTASTGSIISGKLGTTEVADSRGSLLGWTVTAASTTAEMSTGGTSPKTIALGTTGPLAWNTGTVTASGSSLLGGVSAGLPGVVTTTAITAATAALGAGGGTYTYNPTLALTVPPNTETGTYGVVIRQTVA